VAVTSPARPAARWRAELTAAAPSIVLGLVWVALASFNSIAELLTFNSTSRDIGVYLQMLWNTAHGRPFQTTLLESNRLHLAEHVAVLLPMLSPLYALRPSPSWLFAAQSTVLALAVVPVYLLARGRLGGVLLPTLFVAGFFLMPAVTEIGYDAFYPVTWTALPLGFATYFLLTDRPRPGAALALLALPMEEEAGLAVLGLGLLLLLRRGRRLLGAALTGLALLWLGLVALVVMPRFHEPSTLPSSGENRTIEHFALLRQHPIETLEDLAVQRAPRAARWLLAPTGGLPLLAPQVLVVDAPQAATLLLADKGERFRRHWAAPMLPSIWLAAIVGYAALRGRRLRLLGIGLMIAGTVVTYRLDSNLPGGGDFDPADVAWSERAEQDAYVVARVPPGASLVASRRFLGGVADRAELYVFPPSYLGRLWPPERRPQTYLLDLTNDGTREALIGRQSPLRASRPYAIWTAGPDALLLLERAPEPSRVLDRDLAGIRLRGLDLARSGALLELTAHWQATAKPDQALSRVVSVLDARGNVLAAATGTALDELLPTDQWPPGQVVIDRARLELAPGMPDRVRIGWVDERGAGDTIEVPIEP
jgi:uncharacterized membrane protein